MLVHAFVNFELSVSVASNSVTGRENLFFLEEWKGTDDRKRGNAMEQAAIIFSGNTNLEAHTSFAQSLSAD